ncbi:MAG: hypothetical protein Kow0077_15910 [Anaerolineae bacterium]
MPDPALNVPRRSPALVFLTTGTGLVVLLWLSSEDTGLIRPVLAGLALSGVILVNLAVNRFGGRACSPGRLVIGYAVLGSAGGVFTSLLTALLMLLKTTLHGHPQGDFPLPILGAILAHAPAWGLAGLFIGAGLGLLWIGLKPGRPSE